MFRLPMLESLLLVDPGVNTGGDCADTCGERPMLASGMYGSKTPPGGGMRDCIPQSELPDEPVVGIGDSTNSSTEPAVPAMKPT